MKSTICDCAGSYLRELASLAGTLDHSVIDKMAERIFIAWQENRLVLTFGNGGSAFTASHFVTDLVKTADVGGQLRRLRAISLSDNMGLVTATGNDIGYDSVFVYPLESFAHSADIAIAISASGNSPNVVNACRCAKDRGLELFALTGFSGGKIGDIADLHLNVPSSNYGLIEDLHLSVGHMLSQTVRSLILRDISVS